MSRTSDRACARAIACKRVARPRAARPAGLTRCALALMVAAAGMHAQAADDCASALNAPNPLIAEGNGVRVAFAPRPAVVPIGRHFQIQFVVCSGNAVRGDAQVKVDADMPAHRHGMNYRAVVAPAGGGVQRADGLMFHMPGTWRVMFDVALDGRTLRVSRELEVQ